MNDKNDKSLEVVQYTMMCLILFTVIMIQMACKAAWLLVLEIFLLTYYSVVGDIICNPINLYPSAIAIRRMPHLHHLVSSMGIWKVPH